MRVPPVLKVFEKVDDLFFALASFFISSANEAIEENGTFMLSLSGGNSPKRLYELLASDKYKNKVDWTKVHFFFGDERYVPLDSLESNFLMAKTTLFDPLGIPKENIHAVNTSLTPEEAALDYFKELRLYFKEGPVKFDFILLGLGDNAHTASLFPYTPVLLDKSPSVKSVFVEELDSYRITFNAPLINQARRIVFLVYGEDKTEAVSHVLGTDQDFEKYPAQLIHSNQGLVYWFLDEKVARRVLKEDY